MYSEHIVYRNGAQTCDRQNAEDSLMRLVSAANPMHLPSMYIGLCTHTMVVIVRYLDLSRDYSLWGHAELRTGANLTRELVPWECAWTQQISHQREPISWPPTASPPRKMCVLRCWMYRLTLSINVKFRNYQIIQQATQKHLLDHIYILAGTFSAHESPLHQEPI